jgi:non-ribosomal peptide synthetase component F
MVESENGLRAEWLYSTDLFERTTILRMAKHFETLLSDAIASPENRLSALSFRSEQEQRHSDEQKKERKQSQLKKLMTLEPKAASLTTPGNKE